jgi:iron complex transport system substrate-binding protein
MHGRVKITAMMIMLCLSLMLGACSAPTNTNGSSQTKANHTATTSNSDGQAAVQALDKFRRISEIFGKQKEAEQWITEYEKKAAEARTKIQGIVKDGETVSIVQVANKSIYVLAAKGGNYGSPTIYQMLKLPPTKKALNMKEGFENISLEVLPEYMGDHIFVYGSEDEGANQILHSELWKGLQLDTIVNLLLAHKK